MSRPQKPIQESDDSEKENADEDDEPKKKKKGTFGRESDSDQSS